MTLSLSQFTINVINFISDFSQSQLPDNYRFSLISQKVKPLKSIIYFIIVIISVWSHIKHDPLSKYLMFWCDQQGPARTSRDQQGPARTSNKYCLRVKGEAGTDLVVGGGDPADLVIEGRAGAGEFPAVRPVVLHPSGSVRTLAPVTWRGQYGD